MLRIGIFDDNLTHLDYIYNCVLKEMKQHKIDYTVDKIYHLDSIDESLNNHTFSYDVLFWDIQLNEGNTLQLARKIYQLYPDVQMVYVTGYNKFYDQIFDSNVLYYVDKKDFEKKINQIINKMVNIYTNQRLVVKNKDCIPVIDMKDIIYIERKLRVTYIKCNHDNHYRSRDKLSDMMGLLNQKFIRTHNSFVVNMDYIEKMTRTSVYLKNGIVIPISRQYHKVMKDKLFHE